MPPDPLRSRTYKPPPEASRDEREMWAQIAEIQGRLRSVEDRVEYVKLTQRHRYAQLRGFRVKAIKALYALDKLTLTEMSEAFGVTKQRIAQIGKRGR